MIITSDTGYWCLGTSDWNGNLLIINKLLALYLNLATGLRDVRRGCSAVGYRCKSDLWTFFDWRVLLPWRKYLFSKEIVAFISPDRILGLGRWRRDGHWMILHCILMTMYNYPWGVSRFSHISTVGFPLPPIPPLPTTRHTLLSSQSIYIHPSLFSRTSPRPSPSDQTICSAPGRSIKRTSKQTIWQNHLTNANRVRTGVASPMYIFAFLTWINEIR